MTTDSYGAAMRPLLLTAVWFAFLACAAFAWAAVESDRVPQQTTLVSR
jgi:hypothetical protein